MEILHGRVSIELHLFKQAPTSSAAESLTKLQPLLLLHALGSNARSWHARPWFAQLLDGWHGPVYALDFSGHGQSGRIRGGAYHPEYFLADADLALKEIDAPCYVVGEGIGAYVGLMLAGARPESVVSALLLDGAGLNGGGSTPEDEILFEGIEGLEEAIGLAAKDFTVGTDPWVAQCGWDLRPLDYAAAYGKSANALLFSSSVGRDQLAPGWLQAAREANFGSLAPTGISAALDALAAQTGKTSSLSAKSSA